MGEAAGFVAESEQVKFAVAKTDPPRPGDSGNLVPAEAVEPVEAPRPRRIVLDRSGGKKLGVRLGNAASPDAGIPILHVDPAGQANGKVNVGDMIMSINGNSVLGMSMGEAAGFVAESETLALTIHPTSASDNGAPVAENADEHLYGNDQAQSSDGDAKVAILDRSDGQKLGIRLGNSPDANTGIPILHVDSSGQAAGKLNVGDIVEFINGKSVVGMTMAEAAAIVTESEKVELTLQMPDLESRKSSPNPDNSTMDDYEMPDGVSGSAAPGADSNNAPLVGRTVVLDRSAGKKLGIRLGNAPSDTEGIPVNKVDSAGQASGKIAVGEVVNTINGQSVLGCTMADAASFVMQSDSVELGMEEAQEPTPGSTATEAVPELEVSRVVTLDRSKGSLGIKMGNAPDDAHGVPILKVEEDGQAFGQIAVNDEVVTINGQNVLGFTKAQTATYVMRSGKVSLGLSSASSKAHAAHHAARKEIHNAPSSLRQMAEDSYIRVTLDRNHGTKLGLRQGNAPHDESGIPVTLVDPEGQAAGKLEAGDEIMKICGNSVVGATMSQAAAFIMNGGDHIALDRAPRDAERAAATLMEDDDLSEQESAFEGEVVSITIDREEGAPLGLRLGNASPGKGVPILHVNPDGAANNQVAEGNLIVSVAGKSVLGFSMKEIAASIKTAGNPLVLGCAEDPDAQPAEFNSDPLNATTEKENPYSEVRVFQGAGVVRRGSHFVSGEAVEPEGEEDAAVNEIASSLMSQ